LFSFLMMNTRPTFSYPTLSESPTADSPLLQFHTILPIILQNIYSSMTYLPSVIVPHGAKVATANPITKRKLDPLDHSITTEFRTRLTWGREPVSDAHPTSSSTIDTTAVK
ncbi:MAG: hypothetical protein ACK56F_26280, partial [bacterium]